MLYNSDSGEYVGVLPFEEGFPDVLRFSRNGKLLLAAGGRGAHQGLAVVWDAKTAERIIQVGDEYDSVLAADINPFEHNTIAYQVAQLGDYMRHIDVRADPVDDTDVALQIHDTGFRFAIRLQKGLLDLQEILCLVDDGFCPGDM